MVDWGWAFTYMLGALVLLIGVAVLWASKQERPEFTRQDFEDEHHGKIVALMGLTRHEYDVCANALWYEYRTGGIAAVDAHIKMAADSWRK